MIKSKLVDRIATQNPHLYQRDVARVVDAIFERITDALKKGDRVEIRGFGAFSVRVREARTGRNPRTGQLVSVKRKINPYFKSGKEIRTTLNLSSEEVNDNSVDMPPIATPT
jgi:integration host factor subunit beta